MIGTPEMAIACIERLQQSNGGFGAYLLMGAEVASRGATLESYQLFAEEVMPHFQGQLDTLRASHDWVRTQAAGDGAPTRWVAETATAIQRATEEYKAERAGARPDGSPHRG